MVRTQAFQGKMGLHHANAWVPNFRRLQLGQLPGGKALKRQNIGYRQAMLLYAHVDSVPVCVPVSK